MCVGITLALPTLSTLYNVGSSSTVECRIAFVALAWNFGARKDSLLLLPAWHSQKDSHRPCWDMMLRLETGNKTEPLGTGRRNLAQRV